MLNKWKLVWQDVGYKHLAIALVCSLLVHLLLMGELHVNLSDLNIRQQVLEARLILPKPSHPINAKSLDKVQPIKRQVALPIMPVINQSAISASSQVSQDDVTLGKLTEPATQETHEIPLAETEAEDIGFIVNANPYQYIESEFDLYVGKAPSINDSPTGKAKIIYQIFPEAEKYRIESLMQAKGLASLFIPDLLQTSDGYVNRLGLQPQHYLYQIGSKKNKTYTADFDWESKKIKLQSEGAQQKLDLAEGSQDLLSFMYQFMYVEPMQNMQLSITNGKKIALYVYSFEGEEIISTKMGDLKTVHIARTADESEKKTELWLSLDYQYVPVKIREREKDGKIYELVIKSLKTENPILSPQ
jgi:hypothetical protein